MYSVYSDYRTTIQDRAYIQLVQNNDTKRVIAEQWAISIVRGRLTQKYDVDKEFTTTAPWDSTKTYHARDRVIIDYAAYDATKTYAVGVCVIQAGIGYICTTVITAPEAFTIGHWTAIGPQYAIYYADYPSTCTYQTQPNPATLANPFAPEFALIDISKGGAQNLYATGDVVYWKGFTYTAAVDTIAITDQMIIQYISYKDVPYSNVFPDDIANNANNEFWGTKTAYTVSAGVLPTDATKWVLGDNRTPEMLEMVKDITIWKLSSLLNSRQSAWDERYNCAVSMMTMYANGTATLLMPTKPVPSGTRARSGSKVKQNNTY